MSTPPRFPKLDPNKTPERTPHNEDSDDTQYLYDSDESLNDLDHIQVHALARVNAVWKRNNLQDENVFVYDNYISSQSLHTLQVRIINKQYINVLSETAQMKDLYFRLYKIGNLEHPYIKTNNERIMRMNGSSLSNHVLYVKLRKFNTVPALQDNYWVHGNAPISELDEETINRMRQQQLSATNSNAFITQLKF